MIPFTACKTQLLEAQSGQSDHDISLKAKGFTLDDLGYLYLISSNNE